jgi:hypothetical protein
VDDSDWGWVSQRTHALTPNGGRWGWARRWRKRQQALLTVCVVALFAATVSSIATSGATTVATATPFVNPSSSIYDGPVSVVTSVMNHPVCSPYASGQLCATITMFTYEAEPCHPASCAPTQSRAPYRHMWAVPDAVRVALTNSGNRPFLDSVGATTTSLSFSALDPVQPQTPSEEVGQTVQTASQSPVAMTDSSTTQCGRQVSSPWVTLSAHGRSEVCLFFPLPQWPAADGQPDPQNVVNHPLGGIALWEEFTSPSDYGVPYSGSPSLVAPTKLWPSPVFDVVPPYDDDVFFGGIQQVVGSPNGHIVYGPTSPTNSWWGDGSSPRRGVVLLMVRQRDTRGQPEPTTLTNVYINVATLCSSTGCAVSRLAPDAAVAVSRVAACRGARRFTCVPFDLPTDGRIISGGYNLSLWSPISRETVQGVVFGSGCETNGGSSASETVCKGTPQP